MSSMAAMAAAGRRQQKNEGDISAVFTSLRPDDPQTILPPRFAELKRELWQERLVQSWKEVLNELEVETKRIEEKGEGIIPKLSMESIRRGLTEEEKATIRAAGCVVVKGGIPEQEARSWKEDIQKYVAANPGVKGFPADHIQVFELYNTVSQIRARTHPNVLETQRTLLSLWHDPSGQVGLDTPVSYFDRLRIRYPGDSKFTLGPHIDGGSIERWEDPQYRECFSQILKGAWKQLDSFNASPRIDAKQDLYNAPSQCSIFRPWQGWTAMSSTGPGEGTLRVFPSLKLATAYWVLRPFFRARYPTSASLSWENWNQLDLDGSAFPGSGLGTGLELNEVSHPHLRLSKTMISMPRVKPGDQVYWHCDTIHAVEGFHGGKEDSSVMYIPAVPLTVKNAQYLRDQRSNFLAGLPAPDFPGGPGESTFSGGATVENAYPGGSQALGFERFGAGNELFKKADEVLFAH
ncbi:DUF1479-domain-containing protein [Roridomyces roridus]|uniref:DUF1479-domain-containing protein n=1 Tax=Roridomyces roridus TaxID=1738132 RepID=A0AAD7FI96_9AGAR|nr:DUF1479-domain-containing protein [Roridomyces roridus]